MQEQSTGAMLSAARQSAGLTVAQLSEITRIREAIIYAIERDDYSQCGGEFYIRGHLRAFAKVVGMDPEATVQQYDHEHGGPSPVRAAAVFGADRKIRLNERRTPNWTMALGVAVAIVVVFGVVRVLGGDGLDGTRTAGHAPKVPPNAPLTERPRGKASQMPNAASAAAKDIVVVRVKAKRSSFLSVRDSEGHKLFSGTLQAGRSSTYRANSEVHLVIGDGGAVSLQVNGKNLGHPGGRGEMVRRSFGPSAARPR